MIAINDILEVQYNFSQQGVTAKMIQYCRPADQPINPEPYTEAEVARNIFDKVATIFASIISSSSYLESIYVRNRSNSLYEGYSDQDPVVGTGGTVSPPFVALGIFQARQTTITRNGYKRFPFPSEARTTGNSVNLTVTQSDFLKLMFGAGFLLEDPEGFYDEIYLQNVIIPRNLVGTPPEYVLDYENPNPILQATPNRVTTQNSRKT